MFYRILIISILTLGLAYPAFAENVSINGVGKPAPVVLGAKVNINTATVNDLLKVNGMNASKARAIVLYRKKNGNFKSLDDLSKVKGFIRMKEVKRKEIENQLMIG